MSRRLILKLAMLVTFDLFAGARYIPGFKSDNLISDYMVLYLCKISHMNLGNKQFDLDIRLTLINFKLVT